MRFQFLIICLLPMLVQAQTVFESMITLSKTYRPLFGKESSVLTIDLVKQYTLGAGDTIIYLTVKVDQRVSEATGYSIGASIFGGGGYLGAAGSGSKTYAYQKENGLISMGYEQFNEFYGAVNKTFTYISTLNQSKSNKQNSICTYQFMDIVFGGEFNPNQLVPAVTYYVKVGEAIFTMDEPNFIEIARTIRTMKLQWDKYK